MSNYSFTENKLFEMAWKKANDPSYWAFTELCTDLFDNQIETVRAVCDKSLKGLAILQARGAGKTFAVAVGLLILCLSYVGLRVGVFAPKEDQATRIIKEMTDNILKPGLPVYQKVNWPETVNSRLVFNNGSVIEAMSASETTQQEGWHFNIVVLDEAHRVSDEAFSQRIFPMTSGMDIGKVIKIGIPIGKGHFYKSCSNGQYKLIKKGWLDCHILFRNGSLFYHGQEYPERIVHALSLPLKQKMFPDRPDLHFEGEIGEFEFKTQYSMEWADDTFLELATGDREKLLSGSHTILSQGSANEEYYFGIDTAPGTQKETGKDLDSTVLSIWRKRIDNVKEKVYCKEWRGDIVGQFEEIERLIHPLTGIFRCRFGLVDYSNIAQSMVAFYEKNGIPIEGIMYQQNDPISKKNYKNAIFDESHFEIENGRAVFPALEKIEQNPTFKKSYNEWCSLERHKGTGTNDQIQAPSGLHDDHPNADALAVFAANKMTSFKSAINGDFKFPKYKSCVSKVSVQNPSANSRHQSPRFLPNGQIIS